MTSAGYRRPVSVLVVVYTDAAEVLLLKQSRPFAFWQSVTGSVHAGESAGAAASRELTEETGLIDEGVLIDTGTVRTFEIDPRWQYRFPPGVTENREHEWRFRLATRAEIVLDAMEHSAFEWCPIEDAVNRVWSWTNKEALEQLRVSM